MAGFENSGGGNIGFFIIDYSGGGGVERATADLISKFQNAGYGIKYLASLVQSGEPKIDYPESLEITVLEAGQKNSTEELVYQYLRDKKLDFLIFQGDNMSISLAVLKAAKRADTVAIPQYHGSPYAYLKKYPEAQNANAAKIFWAKLTFPLKKLKLEKFLNAASHGVVCVSEGSAIELKKLFPSVALQNRIVTIHNPMKFGSTANHDKQKVVSFVSRLENRHKNAFLILKAWEIIAKKYPDWTLKIYGDGPLKNEFQEFIAAHHLRNVELKGFVKEIYSELDKSAISVSTSNTEGFSMAIAEAIAAGNAVAITDADGGLSDMVKDKQTGLVSPKNNPKKLAENISLLIDKEELRESLAVAAYRNLQSLLSADIIAKWQELLAKK